MSSDRKVVANRINAKKSTGPRSLRGKLQSNRNAWRHGLAAVMIPEPTVSADVKRMANAICGEEHADPDLYDLAVTIARWQVVLFKVRDARVERERLINPKADRLKQTDEAQAPLDRYERRALSGRNRAIQRFHAIRIVRRFLSRQTKRM